jgi:hypothetical protein
MVLASWPLSAHGQNDYLSTELRQAVEQLKSDAAETPTDAINVLERAPVIWAWMNAQAMRSEKFLIDLPLWLSYPLGLPDEPILPMAIRAIDLAIRELQIKDVFPGAVGTISVDSKGPFLVNSHQTIRQTYTVGSHPMAEGGGLLLAHQLMADYGVPQTHKPAEADYLTITCSNPDATFKMGRFRIPSFIHGVYPGTPISFTLEGTSLQPGETITVTYGDTSEGSPGFLMQSSENDEFILPIYVDLEGNRNFFSAQWPGIRVVGDAAAGVHVVAPSVVTPNETFKLAIRFHDTYYNRATRAIPEYEITLDGETIRSVAAPNDGLAVIDNLSLDSPGVYRFNVRSKDGAIHALSNPIWVQENPPYRIYWGETHGHTSYAEGQGSVANYFRYGRDDARLDFIALSEHDAWMDDWEWSTLVDAASEFSIPGQFVPFLSFEWTAKVEFGGHHNILFRTAPGRERVPVQTAGFLSDLFYGLREQNAIDDVLVIPHAHMPGDWRQNDPQLGRLVEITSMHGTFEWFGNYYLKNGHEVGFVGASDNHEGRPGFSGDSRTGAFQHFGGLGAVMANEKSANQIFNAMRNIDAYATSDSARIILDADLNGSPMGKRIGFDADRTVRCAVMGTSPIDYIDIIKNGDIVETQRYLSAPLTPQCQLKIEFESTSENGLRDSPRGDRIWQGTIQIENATIDSVSIPGLSNPYVEHAEISDEDESIIAFHNETRGRGNTILIDLSGASADTEVTINLDPAIEHGITYPIVYRPSVFPKRTLTTALPADVKPITMAIEEGRFTDHISFEIVEKNGSLDQEFKFTETEVITHGDYYYVRATQLDGARAWSSPWWVGSFPPR